MKVTPDDYGRRCQFDHFCKLVLYHEAVDYFRERKRQRTMGTGTLALLLGTLAFLLSLWSLKNPLFSITLSQKSNNGT